MSDWIPSQVALRDHPKTRRAARMLSVRRSELCGCLHFLWWWALEYAPDGDIEDFEFEDLADAADWPGDPAQFVEALLNCGSKDGAGFLAQVDGRLVIHDWEENQGDQFRARVQAAAKKRAQRAKTEGDDDVRGAGDTVIKAGDSVPKAGDSVPKAGDSVPKAGDSVPTSRDLARAKDRQDRQDRQTPSGGTPSGGATPVENSGRGFADLDLGEEDPPTVEEEQPTKAKHTDGQELVAFYVDERTKAGSAPTRTQVGIIAKTVGDKLQGGAKPETLREAIKRMITKGKAVSHLPAFIDEVEAERHVMRPRSTVPEIHEPTPEERAAALEAARKAREQVQAMSAGIGRAMP